MNKLKSRKLWVTVIAGVLVIMSEELGLPVDKENLLAFAAMVVAYVTGQSLVDRQKAKTNTDPAPRPIQGPAKAEPNTDELHQG